MLPATAIMETAAVGGLGSEIPDHSIYRVPSAQSFRVQLPHIPTAYPTQRVGGSRAMGNQCPHTARSVSDL